jgi:hypothetical protein
MARGLNLGTAPPDFKTNNGDEQHFMSAKKAFDISNGKSDSSCL